MKKYILENIEKENELYREIIREREVIGIDYKGNLSKKKIEKQVLYFDNKDLTKEYDYLEWIDTDTYIFGEITYDKYGFDYNDTMVEKNDKTEYRYGIFKLTRDSKGDVIPMGERIVVPAIYTSISPNNSKTVTAYANEKEMTYFDYEKEVQLVPAKLTQAVPFDVDYDGFAECTIGEDKHGYLARHMIPTRDINEVKLFTKEEVKLLTKYEKNLASIIAVNNKYVDATEKSYDKRKKFEI